jgi:hypothetical protein
VEVLPRKEPPNFEADARALRNLPNRPAASDRAARRGRHWKVNRGPPTRAADALRLGLRRRAHRCHTRAHFTHARSGRQPPTTGTDAGGTRKPIVAAQLGPRMKCGWGCGVQFTGRNMRAHFTICAKRPADSGDVERRGGSLQVHRGCPPGRRMRCGGSGRQVHRSSDPGAFHNMREPAGSLR